MVIRRLMLPVFVLAASCSKSGPTPSAPPAPVAPPPATAGSAPGRGGTPAGAPGAPGGGRGTPLTPEQTAARRDSIAALRAATVAQLMTTIVGKEEMPAGQVFKNVQIMKDVPARRFLIQMDSAFGRGLSLNCSSCHVPNDFASDSLPRKKTARIMADIVNNINNTQLTKLNRPANRRPEITCVTCHRGNGNPGNRILP